MTQYVTPMCYYTQINEKGRMLMISDIFVHYIDFKNSIPATSTVNDDGSYSIFINNRLSHNMQSVAYIHELNHILQLDFESRDRNIDVLEYYAHKVG